MGLRIGTNVSSLSAQRNLSRNEKTIDRAVRELSSGSRVSSPGDDAAGFAIAEGLRSQIASLNQARKNADGAVGFVQVAEGALSEQNDILVRLRELSIQAASDTVNDDEREFLNEEYQQLTQEFERIAQTTRFGSKQLLTGGSETFEFHLGAGSGSNDVVRYKMDSDTRSSTIGVSGLSVASKSDANDSIGSLDEGMVKLAKVRSSLGAMQSRLEHAGNNLDIQKENVTAAHSRIADVDVATAVSDLTRGKLQQEFGTSVLAQANSAPSIALRLLG